MANHYSTLFATEADQNTLVANKINPVGEAGGRLRYKRMYINTDQVFATDEVIRMGTFKSSDRIFELTISCPDMGTTGDFDIGLYLTGTAHDGVVVDDNLFCDALDVNAAALSRVEAFTEAALDDFDRGKMIWQLLGLASDPGTFYDLTISAVEATTNTSAEVLLECFYNAGD